MTRCSLLGWILVTWSLTACGGDPPPTPSPTTKTDAAAEVSAKDSGPPRTQFYAASYTFHGGKFDGKSFEVDRDLSKVSGVLSFGNSHLTPPAMAFAMEDSVNQVVKGANGQAAMAPLTLQLRFGILVEAVGFPINTGNTGVYPLGCKAPMMQVKMDNLMYRSTCPLSVGTGQIEITQWASSPGGKFSGLFKGRAFAYNYNSSFLDDCNAEHTAQTCKQPQVWVDVEGEFDFTLPPVNGDVCVDPNGCPP